MPQAGLTDFAAPGSEVFIVGTERPPDFPEGVDDVWQVEGRSVRHIPGDILDVRSWGGGGGAGGGAGKQGEIWKLAEHGIGS